MYQLEKLKYAFNDLEPHYDAQTVEIHYTKHHQSYVDNLNSLLQKAEQKFQTMNLETLLMSLDQLPTDLATGIRNNAGGHYAHTLFWNQFAKKPQPLNGKILEFINNSFGSKQQFITIFEQKAKTNFGSGWTWLVLNQNNQLEVINTSGHNTPLELNLKPLMVIDIWEHAYYLKFQNKRNEWINAFWNILDWAFVNERLNSFIK